MLVAALVLGGGLLAQGWQSVGSAPASALLAASQPRPGTSANFEICKSVRETCVVDGDTFWLNGMKIRIADIDTPEISQPRCAAEQRLGEKAKHRLRDLLNAGPFQLAAWEGRDQDKYGRKLRVVVRDGKSLGDHLVSEGLARTWAGRREPWC
ncbi:MAG TPA: thermonuclease family protein [Pseudorhizobium sp.]|nr:thermonuclease family protein [Pseudorhizobium sp.]